ncbi:MAG TPA: hypothetical protein PLH94_04885 [Fimbriimonadaceae bacterium]|nr:hypothetical protein [Fimbriimonadaceae bacterium]
MPRTKGIEPTPSNGIRAMPTDHPHLGTIVILNGVPRSGKSSLARAIQAEFDGVWIHLGVDQIMDATPKAWHPGIGLRPGGERPDLEPLVQSLYSALYASITAHSREGLNVVADVGHHDDYSEPLGTLLDAARQLDGHPAYLIGVRCPVDTVVERRRETGWAVAANADGAPATPVLRWEQAVHDPGIYDLEVDTSLLSSVEAADQVRSRLASPPAAWERIRGTR